MPYVVVEDFKLGMDVTNPRAVGVPGSLWLLVNAHITRGGRIQSRKKFVSKYSLPVGTYGLHGIADTRYVFGSGADPGVPSGVTYQRLQHPDGMTQMARVLQTESVDAKPYVVAEYADGAVYHFYDGSIVSDWFAGLVRADQVSLDNVAEQLRALIDASTSYSATRSGAAIDITGPAGSSFTVDATATDGGAVDDQTAAVTSVQTAVPAVAEVLSTTSFRVTGGTSSAGVNYLDVLTINGVDILGANVDWTGSHAVTAAAIADQINSYTSAPNYTATADNDTVTVSAVAGTGAGPNTFPVVATGAGDVTVSTPAAMSGGVTAVSGVAQISRVTLGGTFDPGDKFTISLTLNNIDRPFGAVGNPERVGRTIHLFKNKLYSTVGPYLFFSAVGAPTVWNRDDPDSPGANFINVAKQAAGADEVFGTQEYEGNLAVFGRRGIQIWSVDADESQNVFLQNVKNTGTRSPRAIVAFGNSDVFYLADSGIRSLRARNTTNAAFASDVGVAIDENVKTYLRTLTDDQKYRAVAVMEPDDDRYWLAVGERIYVFSFFPSKKISAWSYYEPGFAVSDFARCDSGLYVRGGDTIYLYGGDGGTTYPEADEMTITVKTPFLSANTVGTKKNLKGYDQAAVGDWAVKVLVHPEREEISTQEMVVNGNTFPDPEVTIYGPGTSFALDMTCSSGGEAMLYMVALHYDPDEAT
jgi:hypothetical protein